NSIPAMKLVPAYKKKVNKLITNKLNNNSQNKSVNPNTGDSGIYSTLAILFTAGALLLVLRRKKIK
ncbi:LPXTG cell wall anchor domain-containing protein, partial [Helcococcus bovis]